MNLFRKYILILPLFGAYFIGAAQSLGKLDVRRGVDPYFLGSVRQQQDSSIKLAEGGKLEYNGRTEYTYVYPAVFEQAYNAGGVYFKNALFTYVADTLVKIELSNIYTPRLYPDYDKKAKQEFRRLCAFLKEQWQRAGRKRKFLQTPDKRIVSEGLQWNTDTAVMKAALYEDKSKTSPLYIISVTLERSGYE